MAVRLNDIEVAFRLHAEKALRDFDAIAETAKDVDKKISGLTGTLDKIGTRLTVFGAAITGAFALAAKGAEEEAKALRQLEGTVNSTGASFEDNAASIDQFITSLSSATGFTDEDLVPALNRAVVATNDLDKGMRAADLGAKLAAAGFGSLEGNAALVARLFEGQVQAIGRLIPSFRDLEERLAAGETEATLAAEALGRLQRIADTLEAPSSLQLMTNQLGELKDAAGFAVIEGLDPFFQAVTKGARALTEFAESGTGKVVLTATAVAGGLSLIAGGALLLTSQLITAGAQVVAFATKFGLAQKAMQAFGLLLSPGGLVIGGLIALAFFVAKSIIELNKLSKASDEARDRAFKAPRLQQFTAEMNALRGVVNQLEAGTISAAEAQKVFNRFGVENEEQARRRIDQLDGIVDRLKLEKDATDDLREAQEEQAKATAEQEELEKKLNERSRERIENIKLEIAEEERLAEARAKFQEVGVLDPVLPASDLTPDIDAAAQQGLDALRATDELFAGSGGTGALDPLLEGADIFIEKTGTIEERLDALGESEGPSTVVEQLELANAQAVAFNNELIGIALGGADALATGIVEFGSDLATSFDEAGKNAAKFFRRLIGDLIKAISKAVILQGLIGSPGGPVGGLIGSLFQDPVADQLARFEGSRFSDLFFQGMFREFNTARERMDVALADNRDLVASNSRNLTAIVNQATPETTVEFTDRQIEPRIRQRSGQRTSSAKLTGSETDRLVRQNSIAIDQLRGQSA